MLTINIHTAYSRIVYILYNCSTPEILDFTCIKMIVLVCTWLKIGFKNGEKNTFFKKKL